MSLMLYIGVVLQDLLLSGVLRVHSWRAVAHSAAGSAMSPHPSDGGGPSCGRREWDS